MYVEEQPRETTFESFHPVEEKMRILEDWELESLRSGGGRKNSRFSLTSSLKRKLGSIRSLSSSKRAAIMDGLVEEHVDGNVTSTTEKKKKEKEKPKEKQHL